MPDQLVRSLLLFVRTLRAAGVLVRAGGALDAIHALETVGVRAKSDVRLALRAVLVYRHDDYERFDALFEQFWRARGPAASAGSPQPLQPPARRISSRQPLTVGSAAPRDTAGDAEAAGETSRATYSRDETWRTKDLAAFTPDEFARARAQLDTLDWRPGVRTRRRWQAGRGRTPDLRRVLQANRRYAGEWITLPRRSRRVAPRRLIVICDISGSMEPYARMLLFFAHAVVRRHHRVEVFLFSTRLTRVTRQFEARRIDDALAAVRRAVPDWSGGTRIGEAVHAFNARWARRVVRGGSVVLLISDGWDLGRPDLLRREIARLQRSVFRLIWLNPMIGSPGYEPLTRGLQAALPYVDDFLSVRDMRSLEALADRLNHLPASRPARRAYQERPWN